MTVYSSKNLTKKERVLERGHSIDDYDDWDSRYMLRSDQDDFGDKYNDMWGQKGWFKPSCVPISIILILIVLVVLLPLLDHADKQAQASLVKNLEQLHQCRSSCRFTLVESIPDGMSYRNGTTPYPTTFQVWSDMISNAKDRIEIASYYWTLRDGDVQKYPGSDEGEKIFQALLTAGTKRGLTVKIAQNMPSRSQPNLDTEILSNQHAAEVRSLNFPRLVGSGILHTKLWMVDRSSVYVGSANTDWRSLTQVKEMGIYIQNCSCVVDDIAKIFDVYWMLGEPDAMIPSKWPDNLATPYNKDSPMDLSVNGSDTELYISSSPPKMCPPGRTADGTAITDIIGKANKFVYIAVMDYFPLMIYTHLPRYWGDIDTALRTAAINKCVQVRLLISWWKHSRENAKIFLRSLTDLTNSYPGVNITVKLFAVPSTAEQSKIPYARVNHNKYMVTDNTAYIGTSNWSGDYFTVTGGVGFVLIGDSQLRDQLEEVFLRDWNSEFAYSLPRQEHIMPY